MAFVTMLFLFYFIFLKFYTLLRFRFHCWLHHSEWLVCSPFWKQHTVKIFDIWYEFRICDCSKWSKVPLTKYYDANVNHKIEGKKHKHTPKIPKIKYWLENANISIKVKYKAVVFIFICTCIGRFFCFSHCVS